MAYGNCVKQADEKTWDTWGKGNYAQKKTGISMAIFRNYKRTDGRQNRLASCEVDPLTQFRPALTEKKNRI
jgi:hypothetical protein